MIKRWNKFTGQSVGNSRGCDGLTFSRLFPLPACRHFGVECYLTKSNLSNQPENIITLNLKLNWKEIINKYWRVRSAAVLKPLSNQIKMILFCGQKSNSLPKLLVFLFSSVESLLSSNGEWTNIQTAFGCLSSPLRHRNFCDAQNQKLTSFHWEIGSLNQSFLHFPINEVHYILMLMQLYLKISSDPNLSLKCFVLILAKWS